MDSKILGYSFQTKASANAAMENLNQIHGLPVPGGESKFSEESYSEHPNGGYFIPFDEEWTSVLGAPTEIIITRN